MPNVNLNQLEMECSEKNDEDEGESLVVDLQLGAEIAEEKVVNESTTIDELKKEKFAIKFDNGYLFHEN